MNMLYFDYNATAPIDTQVIEIMKEHFEQFGNPSSYHHMGFQTKKLVMQAREQTAELLDCSPTELFFTSGGTESNNWVIKGMVEQWEKEGKPIHIIVSAIEHPSIRDVCKYLEAKGTVSLTVVPVDKEGFVSCEDVRRAIRPDTRMITIMLANNELGTIQPIAEIAGIAAEYGIFTHTDAVQMVGKLPVNVKELGVDALSFSGHKFYGPKGIGGLYLKEGYVLEPLLHGGGQEMGRRSGTENVLSIIGLGAACEMTRLEMSELARRMAEYKELLLSLIRTLDIGIQINGSNDPDRVLPTTINFQFPMLRAEALAAYLNQKYNIAVSVGSACSSNKEKKLSHVLAAIGLTEEQIQSSLRISLGKYTTESQIRQLAGALHEAAQHFLALIPA